MTSVPSGAPSRPSWRATWLVEPIEEYLEWVVRFYQGWGPVPYGWNGMSEAALDAVPDEVFPFFEIPLADDIAGIEAPYRLAVGRRGVDDRAPSRAEQRGDPVLAAQEDPLQVDVDHLLPDRLVGIDRGAVGVGEDPRVVEQHVEAPGLLDRRRARGAR